MINVTGELNLENGTSRIHVVANDDRIIVRAADWGSLSSCISLYKKQKPSKIARFYLKQIDREIHISVGDKKTAVLKMAKIKSINFFAFPRLALAYFLA